MPEQSNRKNTVPSVRPAIRPGKHNNITDVPGIGVGNAEDRGVRTGVSVIIPQTAWTCAGDVRGGGPGTRESDLLDPATLVQSVDAIVLAGGSTYGLAAGDAVTAQLGAQGRGFSLVARAKVPVSPIVPAAILYDLANGGNKDWGVNPPYGALARAALENVTRSGAMALGRVGAGYGARAGQEQGGLGSASVVDGDGLVVGALMAVNSFGSVRMPGSQAFWAWPYEIAGEFGGVRPDPSWGGAIGFPDDSKLGPMPQPGTSMPAGEGARENTTIGVVAVSMALTQAEAQRVAIMAQDGLARAIRPVHAPTDGDVVYVLAPPPAPTTAPADPIMLARIGTLAADCVARAIARAVHEAQS